MKNVFFTLTFRLLRRHFNSWTISRLKHEITVYFFTLKQTTEAAVAGASRTVKSANQPPTVAPTRPVFPFPPILSPYTPIPPILLFLRKQPRLLSFCKIILSFSRFPFLSTSLIPFSLYFSRIWAADPSANRCDDNTNKVTSRDGILSEIIGDIHNCDSQSTIIFLKGLSVSFWI